MARNGRYLLATVKPKGEVEYSEEEQMAPREEVLELARALNAEIISLTDLERSAPLWVRGVRKVCGRWVALAICGFLKGGSFYLTTAENAGMPLAFLLKLRRRVTHVMIAHRISPKKKRYLFQTLNLFKRIDALICLCDSQAAFARDTLRVSGNKVRKIGFQVDEKFFSPGIADGSAGVVSVGMEARDYSTLFRAVDGLDIPVNVVASSPWSRSKAWTLNQPMLANVKLHSGLSFQDLRDLYRRAMVVVLPLYNVDWSAGLNALLEAQAVGRPVIISDYPGIVDFVSPGDTVLTVPCEDANAVRRAILWVKENRQEAEAMGKRGREDALSSQTLNQHIDRIVSVCSDAETRGVP